MTDFSSQIAKFQSDGEFTYNFDDYGNVNLNASSSNFNNVYVAVNTENFSYDNSKIQSFYNIDFTEFVPVSFAATSQSLLDLASDQAHTIDTLTAENTALKSQLDTFITSSQSDMTASNKLAIKQVILDLRKQLGQDKNSSGFSNEFPYLPIPK